MTGSAWDAGPGDAARIRPFLGMPLPVPGAAAEADASGEQATPAPRPFVLTSGRVLGKDSDLGLETQVSAICDALGRPVAPLQRLSPERQAIVTLCAQPLSVAEISARLRLHLAVTRILIDDLRTAGYLTVHALDVDADDMEILVRVLEGLRALH